MYLRRLLFLAVAAVWLVPALARADVKPHALFSDHMVLQRDVPLTVWGMADPGEKINVTIKDEKKLISAGEATANADGTWKVALPKLAVGGPYELTITGKNTVTCKDVLAGEVWVCSGQSNMEWQLQRSFEPQATIESAKNPKLRLFTVPRVTATAPQTGVTSEWKECTPETVPGFSAVGYYFGRDLQKALGVPVGLIHTSWGGTPAEAWTSKEALDAVPMLKYYHEQLAQRVKAFDPAKADEKFKADQAKFKEAVAKAKETGQKAAGKAPLRPQPPDRSQNAPSSLYNAMIAPLLNYPIKGAIWYQGESNAGKAYEYRTLFATMIKDWRARWNVGDFPFLLVQLAPYGNPQANTWPEMREAQLMATQALPNVGMAVITDIGEKTDVHPKKKEPVGARLALLARKIGYGEKIVAMGPVYKSMKTEGNRAILSFDNVGAGLEARDGKLKGFEIAGEDKTFQPADAEIRGETIMVHSDKVEKPVAVRFGWQNFPELNLWNKDGLPATPFRTDDWPGLTMPKPVAAAQRQ